MGRKNYGRRELLQGFGKFGVVAAGSTALWGAGCKKKAMDIHSWQELAVPAPPGSISPRVTAQPNGDVVLSWLEPKEDRTAALRFAVWREARWIESKTVASGQVFSRDQAAAPGILGLSPQNLIAYWSQRSSADDGSGNEISLFAALSNDAGANWTSPLLVNRAAAQPGEDNAYASAVALDEHHATFVWLDGRNWAREKRVQLMSRTVTSDGSMTEPSLLDLDTCTCCSTSIVKTNRGLLAAYRGHTPENIRDISLVQTTPSAWSRPQVAHADHWHIEACPVNGPHLDTQGDRVALIWFTAAQDQPAVKLAFSANGATAFAPPQRIDTGDAAGRAQIVLLPGDTGAAFWLERDAGAAKLMALNVDKSTTIGAPFELSRGANLGYPHAARTNGGILVAWADRNPASQVHAGFLKRA